jgi:deoxyribodipyrimidine photo-lyase
LVPSKHGEGTKKDFEKWCEGKTGVDIVDAGMRELVQTGFLHNRARLIVANYLIHKLKIDWQLGEKFFAKNLIDYDPCVNNGNWQYMTPAGTNNKGYVAYNPDLQKEKYDKEGLYRKKWKE